MVISMNNNYKCSETELTASWEKHFGGYYSCTNCKHSESNGYPPRGVELGKFCPNCGFKMTNPRYEGVDFDYD